MTDTKIVPAIVGVAHFGKQRPWITTPSTTGVSEAQEFLDTAAQYGCRRLDTARMYGQGESEALLGKLDFNNGSFSVDTKLSSRDGGLRADKLDAQLAQSIAALNGIPIRVLYWHAVDRETPFAESLEVMDRLHKHGLYEEFGLCNAFSWEVAEIATICRERGWIRPTVYQGIYNALDRAVEDELLPCLRKFGIRFAAYSPLAGGLLTGIHLDNPNAFDNNVRFSPRSPLLSFYGPRYAHTEPVLRRVKALAEKHGLTLTGCAVRWIVYHSKMRPDDHGVIYGGRNSEQIRASLSCIAKGPLPEEIVKEFDDSYISELKGFVGAYA
ncbi:aflatoxin B1-aldehyde reductase [Vararia minispora EC-137]|uniref:Aflatoxin B1-aldehyde reductase n=1 Tax=Vararia minispora EC-137 TaxID=1314806 RepID=A0ACB8Q5M8_9AGAM|nr:aflatoxin B1-aldehyde reductase [Vararia minispora EC-137]